MFYLLKLASPKHLSCFQILSISVHLSMWLEAVWGWWRSGALLGRLLHGVQGKAPPVPSSMLALIPLQPPPVWGCTPEVVCTVLSAGTTPCCPHWVGRWADALSEGSSCWLFCFSSDWLWSPWHTIVHELGNCGDFSTGKFYSCIMGQIPVTGPSVLMRYEYLATPVSAMLLLVLHLSRAAPLVTSVPISLRIPCGS